MTLLHHSTASDFVSHHTAIAVLCALTTIGCKQSSPPPATASPWSMPSYDSSTQSQMGMMQDLWRRQNEQMQASTAEMQRRQWEQMNELHRQAQEQERLARERRQQHLESQAQLSRTQQDAQNEVDQLRRRAMELDKNNQDLHAQLAKSQQENRLLNDQTNLLKKRLSDTANQLSVALRAREASDKRVGALEASVRRRGGATITANSSSTERLAAISIPGVQVRRDGDVVRMELPSDRVFLPQSARLNPAAVTILDQVAEAIAENYPRQIIGIEGHTDNAPITATDWRSGHQLSAAQAMAVLDQLAQNKGLSVRQLSQAGHGPNYPVASNATEAGKARNRRVEIVIYPETLDRR